MGDQEQKLSTYQLSAIRKKQKELRELKYKEESKKRLTNIVTTKIKTSFIGAIASVEDGFGFLWGIGKPDAELTDDERAMKEVWESVRARILDNGNGQLRGAINEMNINTISWDRYKLELPVKPLDEEEQTNG